MKKNIFIMLILLMTFALSSCGNISGKIKEANATPEPYYGIDAKIIALKNGNQISLYDSKEKIEELIGSEGEKYPPLADSAKQYGGLIIEYSIINEQEIATGFRIIESGIKTYRTIEVCDYDVMISPYPIYEYKNNDEKLHKLTHIINSKGTAVMPHISESEYEDEWIVIDYTCIDGIIEYIIIRPYGYTNKPIKQ